MASITLCPRCSSHLELPIGASPTSQIECPICEAEFLLASVAPRVVPKARVIDDSTPSSFSARLDVDPKSPPAPEQSAEDPDDSNEVTLPREGLSHLLRSTSAWQLAVPPAEPDDVTAEFASDEPEEDERGHVDAAYQDAVPPSAPAAPAPDKLQLEGSRLDQLLSDLMKTPKPSDLLKRAELADPQPSAAAPTFDEVAATSPSPAIESTEELNAAADEADADERYQEYDDIGTAPPQATSGATFADDDQKPVTAEWNEFEESPDAYATDEEDDLDPADQFAQDLDLPTPVRQRRRPSVVRSLVGIVGGGVLGILGGGYFLLWYNGPEGDLLGLSKVLPAAWLPASSSESTEQSAPAAPNPWSTYAEGARDAAATLPPPAPLGGEEPVIQQPALVESNDAPPAPSINERVAMRRDSAVAPATAESPVTPPVAQPSMTEAPTTAEVAAPPTDIAPAPPAWPTTPIVGSLRGVPLYSMADFQESLAGADAAHRQFLAGDLSRKEDVPAMGKAFIDLCGLAERFTLTDPAEFDNELVTRQMAAKQIFRGMAGDPARRNDLAMIAGRWLQHERRQNQGIILLGRVTELHAQGPWTEYTVEIPLGDSVAAAKVLMDGVKFSVGDPIAVVGAIVANPRQAIADYPGDAPQVVVAGFAFPPENFAVTDLSDAGDLFSIQP